MATPVIIDAVVISVLLGFVLCGVKRGLLRTLAGFAIVIVALVGAGIIAGTFSGSVAKVVTPLIEQEISQKVKTAMAVQTAMFDESRAERIEGFQINQLLEELGLDTEMRESMTEQIQASLRDVGGTVMERFVSVVVEKIAYSIIYGVLFLLSFVALLILLNVLMRAMDLVFLLPGLKSLNQLGGGLLGLMEGVCLLFLAVWVARHMGVSFETEPLAQTHILQIFATHTPLHMLSFLQ